MNLSLDWLGWKKLKSLPLQDYRLYLVIQVMSSLEIVVEVGYSIFFTSIQFWPLAIAHFIGALVWLLSLAANRKRQFTQAIILITLQAVFQSVWATYLIGWGAGYHFYLMASIPVIFFSPHRRNRHGLIALLLVSLFVCFYFEATVTEPVLFLEEGLLKLLKFINATVAYGLVIVSCNNFRHAASVTEREVFRLANTDGLTGLVNRRKIQEVLADQMAQLNRYGDHMTVILTDIDHFKVINDTYGHNIGDLVLQEFTRRLQYQLRQTDCFGRWGGEEFLLMLPQTDIHGASVVADKLREAIASTPMMCAGHSISLTATFGLAEYQPGLTLEQLISLADHRLYQGKRNGRNRIETGLDDVPISSGDGLEA